MNTLNLLTLLCNQPFAASQADDTACAQPGARVCCEAADGAAPRLVTRGESFSNEIPFDGGESFKLYASNGRPKIVFTPLPKVEGNPFAALTDWLNISFPFPNGRSDIPEFLSNLYQHIGPHLGGMTERFRGLHGYLFSFDFDHGGAKFAFGGQRGTAFLSLPGGACALIPDWKQATALFRDVLGAKITRWDGAVDDFDGAHTVDWAVEQYHTGGFNAGGNEPKCSQAGNWIKPDGSGRTFYVGKGGNGKMMRIYEKGMQLGSPWDPWVRWELQLTNRDRIIPFEVLLEPGKYVAGAYRCTGWINKEQSRIKTIQKTASIAYEHLVHYANIGYGSLINIMLAVEGSPEKVIEKLSRPGIPRRLDLPCLPQIEKDTK